MVAAEPMRGDPTAELLSAMAQFDLAPSGVVWDGEPHRFPGPGKKKSNDDGWYVAFPDQYGAFFGDHSRNIHEHWQRFNGRRPDDLDPAEWKRMKEEAKAAAEEREKERLEEQERVGRECRQRWTDAKPANPKHRYLVKKGVTTPEGLRQDGDLLLVPMKATEDNRFMSLQTIAPDGAKLFTPGGKAKGTRTTIGTSAFKLDNKLYICEGWATGWSINHVTGSAVVVAFNAQNLGPVAAYHRERYPDAEIIVCADNDRWTSTYRKGEEVPNPGVVFAREAARAARAELVVPEFTQSSSICLDPECPKDCGLEHPTDFNDLLLLEGPEVVKAALEPPPPPEEPPTTEPPPDDTDDGVQTWLESAPFRCLGYDRGSYYYLPRESGQINVLTASGHDRKTLLPLAPLSWWNLHFPASNGVSWTVAADALIRASHRAGVFRPDRLRGRGCWPDDKGIILHLGDQLLPPGGKTYVDPETFKCSQNLIYERLPPLPGPSKDRALTLEESNDLLDCFRALLWQEEAAAYMLAGWCVLAPICGALTWRPHVFLTGGAGAGKTTILQKLVVPLLGGHNMVCDVEGVTTEAGIRQRLRADALPVVFDEAERGDSRATRRLQSVISLARSASSTGFETLKGTTHGSALSFQIRSMFLLSAIGGAVREEADKTRITMLQLKSRGEVPPDERQEHWQRLAPRLEAIKDRTGRELIARTLGWLRSPRLDQTLQTFRAAATTALGDARAGDQYGTLYAGAWTLMADSEPDPIEARELLGDSDLGFYVAEQMPEGMRALQTILQHRERIDTKNGPMTVAIGELLDACREWQSRVSKPDAEPVLKQLGLRVDMRDGDWVLLVANNSKWISKVLDDTPYADNVATALRTMAGVEAGGQVRFHPGLASRTTMVPLSLLDSVG